MRKLKNTFILFFAFAAILSVSSCRKDYIDWEKLRKKEIADRNKYLAENNITVSPKASGLYYIETLKGEGLKPNHGRDVEVKYTGKLLDGTVFDSSDEFHFLFDKEQVIDGWYEGIGYMQKGGKATLIIPSNLAYGPKGDNNKIPKYSTLVFDIELINIQ